MTDESSSLETFKILIIDDDKVDRLHLRRILEKNNQFLAEIIEADSGQKGIQLAEDESIDCILLDYLLPDINGIDVAKSIRSKHSNSLTIIMLTGQGNEHVAVEAMKEGINDYIAKNELTSHFLITMIINNINKCRLEKQLIVNRELAEKNRIAAEEYFLKNELLQNMSHELRTPLNIIIGISNLLYDETFGSLNREQKSALHDVLNSSNELLKLITNVINLTEMNAEQNVFHPQETDLSKLISKTIDVFKPIAKDRKIKINCDIEKNLTIVNIDPSRFTQVLSNYLSNAIKFSVESGVVSIRVSSDSETTFRLEVEDNGIGIRPEDIKKLFVSFQQLDASTTKKYSGTGLGLALVKRIVEMQGGEVGVQSLPGKGSLFFATFKKNIKL